jgi:hypothetical protein
MIIGAFYANGPNRWPRVFDGGTAAARFIAVI